MLKTIRFFLTVSSLALGTLSVSVAIMAPALAQTGGDQGEAPKEVALTQAVINNLLAAQPEMAALQAKAQGSNADQPPDAKAQAKLQDIAKKNGFASLDAYEAAADSVGIVLAGMDPETKAYVGPAALIKKQMAQVQADKTLPAKDKAETLKEMKEAMATAGDNKPAPGNVELVSKNYDKLSEAFQSGE